MYPGFNLGSSTAKRKRERKDISGHSVVSATMDLLKLYRINVARLSLKTQATLLQIKHLIWTVDSSVWVAQIPFGSSLLFWIMFPDKTLEVKKAVTKTTLIIFQRSPTWVRTWKCSQHPQARSSFPLEDSQGHSYLRKPQLFIPTHLHTFTKHLLPAWHSSRLLVFSCLGHGVVSLGPTI